jgi:hypothetical protein
MRRRVMVMGLACAMRLLAGTNARAVDAGHSARADPTMTTLSVTVTPSGVVSIDGGPELDSPVAARRLAPGRHTVRVADPNHGVQRVTHIVLHPGERFALLIDLES